jgi:hypothetical protein
VRSFLASEAGHVAVLSGFTLLGIAVWLKTGDKWLAEIFSAALLYSMRGRGADNAKLPK